MIKLMAAGILANMEGKLGIRAWRWWGDASAFTFSFFSSKKSLSLGYFSSRYDLAGPLSLDF
jgi:hypothetical protein